MKIVPFGDAACLVDLEVDDAPDRAAKTHALAAALRRALDGADVVVGAGNLLVPLGQGARSLTAMRTLLARLVVNDPPAPSAARHTIRVIYDGPDLDEIAAHAGITAADVIARHQGGEVTVELVGFLPGFGYLGPIDPALRAPRRASPRPIVRAGSVGIAGAFTGIYPFASPGGWNVIGRALDVSLFDADRDPPTLLTAGDRVRFERASAQAQDAPRAAPSTPVPAAPACALVVAEAPLGATIQDRGRPGRLGQGIPPSGPLDPQAFAAANRAVGNCAAAAAVEVPLGPLSILARGRLDVSVDGEAPIALRDGESLIVPQGPSAVRYLAVRGGIDTPAVLGSRATLLVAALGGHEGRRLRRGDVLPVGSDAVDAADSGEEDAVAGPLRVTPGPHLDRFPEGAFEALVAATWRVSRLGDRVGVRLEGARIPRDRDDRGLPCPMLRGAVQVATDGTPIVLGPDHPTTGGYPILAVVDPGSASVLARTRPGEVVRFRVR